MTHPITSLTLPAGTQIVLRGEARDEQGNILQPAGSVGVILASPPDGVSPYLVRFPDGSEVFVFREQLTVRKHLRQDALERAGKEALAGVNLYEFVIYRCIVGSRAYGLDQEDSDTDLRGIYLPPAELHWSLYPLPEQLEDENRQECFWELEKFLLLALRANPNILECLYTPLVLEAAPLAQELLAGRQMFLSQMVYQTYNGYVMSQFKKLEGDLRARGEIRWKHAMHLIRLLLSGITILREGFVPVKVEAFREHLLAIRRGETTWEEANAWRLSLHKEFEAALAETRLPEQPDYARVNAFLVRARRAMVP
jgi:predicted nucleotidyltransferase